jgi:hypothetical protein
MVEFHESHGLTEEELKDALQATVNRIRQRIQPHYRNRLETLFWQATFYFPGCQPCFYIAEMRIVKRKPLFGIIPLGYEIEKNILFTVNVNFYYGPYEYKKEIECEIFDPFIIDVVKEEIADYADVAEATAVRLERK